MSPSSTSRFCSTSEQAPQCRSCVLVGTSYQLVSDPRWSACCLQMATQYELQLTESRLAETKLRATCRRLESEGMFAEVFDTYEREIASLQVRCRCKSEAASDAQGLERPCTACWACRALWMCTASVVPRQPHGRPAVRQYQGSHSSSCTPPSGPLTGPATNLITHCKQ